MLKVPAYKFLYKNYMYIVEAALFGMREKKPFFQESLPLIF